MADGPVRRLILGRFSSLAKPREVDLNAHASAVVMSLLDAASPPRVVAYLNRCPHIGTPLNMFPEQFLDRSAKYLHCATHGALFEPTDGLCVHGPCVGNHLTPIPALVEAEPGSADPDDPLVVLLVDERALAVSGKATRRRSTASETASAGAGALQIRPVTRSAASVDAAASAQLPTRSAIDNEFDSILRLLDAARRPRS